MPEGDNGPMRAPEPYWTSGRVIRTFLIIIGILVLLWIGFLVLAGGIGGRVEGGYTVEDESGNVIEEGTFPPEGTVGGTAVTVTGGG
jgi:hypothetical protein